MVKNNLIKDTIYVCGHKTPDTDSIAAAIAYAKLKELTSGVRCIPIRLGPLNTETKYVLSYFGMEKPLLLDSMKSQVKDLEMDKPYLVSEDISLKKAFSVLKDNDLNALPVVDQNEELKGIVSLSDISQCYMEVWDDQILGHSNTPLENIIEVLSAHIVHSGTKREFSGRMHVYALDPKFFPDVIQEGDVVLVGNRVDAQICAIERNCSLLILTGDSSLDEKIKDLAVKKNITVLSTRLNTFMAARMLPQAVPVSYVMSREKLITIHLEDTVDEVKEIMGKTRFRSYPVVDYNNRVIGSISRYHVLKRQKRKIILVDHNEKNQSIDDLDQAQILEIIDHHRIANIFTDGPIYFRNEPCGSTSTIVARMYFECGIKPTKEIAGLLSAAIISDTLLFKSPTSTDIDRATLKRIAKIANIDIEEFAMNMFREGTSLKDKKPQDLLKADVKPFVIQGQRIKVGQVFTVEPSSLKPIRQDLIELMKQKIQENGDAAFVLLLTDIFQEQSEVLCVGQYGTELAQKFEQNLVDHGFIAKGLLSRKKQLIPNLSTIVENSIL